ncbi:hypothetical protein [Devosia sp.]|uniref:hypothetical protein n=1 Tax=Devosia sp. TaxID=1871048 RepID=UPI003F72AA2A
MDQDILFRDRVRERDLDNFLVEELHASARFRAWLLAQLGKSFVPPQHATIRVGKSPQRLQDNRQTDVQLGWFDSADQLVACVLIESKVTADFQPGQAESYAEELSAWRAALGPGAASAILVAPQPRLAALPGREHFDQCVSIEQIVEFLRERISKEKPDDELAARLEARCQLLDALIGKRPGGTWTPITLPEKRQFSDEYAMLAAELVPRLTVRASSDGPAATTKFFTGASLPPGFPAVRIKHELGKAGESKYANLQFDGLAAMAPRLAAAGLAADTGFAVLAGGQSLFVRRTTPGIDPTAPFLPQRQRVVEGLIAVRDLVAWLEQHALGIAAALTPEPGDTSAQAQPRVEGVDARERAMRLALMQTYRECEKLNYRPRYLLEMMEQLGAIATVRALINRSISDGFLRLVELGRLDLSVESLALEPRWEGLFTATQLDLCRRRLDRVR